MTMIRYNPNPWINSFDRVFSDLWPSMTAGAESQPEGFVPRVDIRDQEDAIILSAELPGVAKENIKVEIDNRVLSIIGEKLMEVETSENGFYRSERSFGEFKRSFTLPDVVEGEKIEAAYDNGVLRLTLPKKPEAKPRLIDVQSREVQVA